MSAFDFSRVLGMVVIAAVAGAYVHKKQYGNATFAALMFIWCAQ